MPSTWLDFPRRFTPFRPPAPLTDAEWAAIHPHILATRGRGGRPLIGGDLRGRIEAMVLVCVTNQPWARAAPPPEAEDLQPRSLARQFRRMAHAGLWMRLLGACLAPDAPPVLKAMEYWFCRLARRAMRVLGMPGARMARALGLLSAMPVMPWCMPKPALWRRMWDTQRVLASAPGAALPMGTLKIVLQVMRYAGGTRWQARWAPP